MKRKNKKEKLFFVITLVKNKSLRMVDWGLMVALAVVFATGMLLHPLQGMIAIRLLHKLSSVLLVAGMIVHVIQHNGEKVHDLYQKIQKKIDTDKNEKNN